ncbi:MAG: transglutaminase domain-containing protein [Candidatus Caccosoma sp.]|nr:transglutaminase domain-containing protein [Candidatus Caccosoma sp.]
MSDFMKVKQIYNYLTSEVKYDYETAYSDIKLLNKEQCYYLEGVFLNHYAVCDGKSKAFVLLCKMEGIEAVRLTDFKENFLGHAYNYVKIDNKWYLACTTFGSNRLKISDDLSIVLPAYNMFLTNLKTPYGKDFGYDSKMYEDIKNEVSDIPYDYFKKENLIVNNENELTSIIDNIVSQIQYDNFEIEFQDLNKNDDIVYSYIESLKNKYSLYDLYLVKNRPYENYIYACIFIKRENKK